MNIGRVPIFGNREPSKRLKSMLVDLQTAINQVFDDIERKIENIRAQAVSEGYNEHETILLIKYYLAKKGKTKRQLKYLLHEVPRAKAQKKLTENLAEIGQARNMSMEREQKETISIPSGDKVVDCEQVVNEVNEERERQQKQQEQQPISLDELKPDYTMEDLMLKLDIIQANLDKVLADKKQLEEKYRNNLRTKVVVSKIFREILALKGSFIYANILIDLSQNKYVRLEPL